MKFLLLRCLAAIPTLFAVLCLGFMLTRLLPGDPAALYASQPGMTEAETGALRVELALDKPLPAQFGAYVRGLARGDLGYSRASGRPVAEEIARRLPASLELALCALFIALSLGVTLGIAGALRPERGIDRIGSLLSAICLSIPTFVTALFLSHLLYDELGWLPEPVGRLDPFMSFPEKITGFLIVDSLVAGDGQALASAIGHLVLPALTMAIFALGPIARITRTAMGEALSADYFRAGRARGLGAGRLIGSYALRNALLPITTTAGLTFAYLFGANVVVEKVFAWPGLGSFAMDALVALDYAALQGFLLAVAAVLIAANLLVDLAHALIDPRTAHR